MKFKIRYVIGGVAAIAIVAAVVIAGPYVARVANSASLFAKGTDVVEIPQVSKGFVSQGLDFSGDVEAATGRLYVSGYMADGSSSPVFAYDLKEGAATGQAMSVTLLNTDGSQFTEHCGGLAVDEDHAFVCGDETVNVYPRAAFDKALEEGGSVQAVATINSGFAPAFVLVNEGVLYIGEYYHAPQYQTPESHYVDTASGTNHAVLCAYEADASSVTGYAASPSKVYSLPDMVQGACFDSDGSLLLSCSWGLDSSQIIKYNVSAATKTTIAIDGSTIPLVICDSTCETGRYDAPLFAEEIVILKGRLVINSEASSNKYIVGKLYGADMMRSFDLETL